MCAPVLLTLLKSLQKAIKCSTSLAFYRFPPTRLINSIKHEHLCKILYVIFKNAPKSAPEILVLIQYATV